MIVISPKGGAFMWPNGGEFFSPNGLSADG